MSQKQHGTCVQCTNCGHVYHIYEKLDLIDYMYVDVYCPVCNHNRGLNLGSNIEDKYILYNVNLDNRYYTTPYYKKGH